MHQPIESERFFELERLLWWSSVDSNQEQALVDELMEKPYLATQTDEEGTTLLMIAAEAANPKLVRLLRGLGADVRARSLLGITPIVGAVLGVPDQGALDAVAPERLGVAEVLIAGGADLNELAYSGCSALHLAIIYTRGDLVWLFLGSGGDPFVRLRDPPNRENSLELAQSSRFRGSDKQRSEILSLVVDSIARVRR